MVFIRPDDKILEQINASVDLSGFIFNIGAEGWAQGIVDELNKGFQISTMIEITDEILKRNGQVLFTSMHNYTFLTRELVDESITTLKRLEELQRAALQRIDDNKNRLINQYGSIEKIPYSEFLKVRALISNIIFLLYWPDKENAEKYGFESTEIKSPILPTAYVSVIPEDNIQYKYNKEITDYLDNSNLLTFNDSWNYLQPEDVYE